MTRRCFPYRTKGRPEREEGTGLCQFQRRRIGPTSFRFGKEGEDEEYQEEQPRKEKKSTPGKKDRTKKAIPIPECSVLVSAMHHPG